MTGISRRIGFSSTTSKDILQAASRIINNNENSLDKLIGRRKLDELINLHSTLIDSKGIAELCSGGVGFDLRFYECLSLAYVCRFNEHHAEPGSEYVVCVDIDDRFKSQTDKELFFSDGVMAHLKNGDVDAFTPMQQVLVQNLYGKNAGKDLTDILVEETNKKNLRRDSYNDISGLVVSVIGNGNPINIQAFIDKVDLNSFLPTFLVIYGKGGNLKRAMVIHMSNGIIDLEELRRRTLKINMPF